MNKRENSFKRKIQKLGLQIERNTQRFMVKGISYLPDFYLPELNTYVEVVGSRQAYEINAHKYQTMVESAIMNIWFVSYDCETLQPKKFLSSTYAVCDVPYCERRPQFKNKIADRDERRLCPFHTAQQKRLGFVEYESGVLKGMHRPRRKVPCKFVGCERFSSSLGYCMLHYNRLTQSGELKTGRGKCSVDGCGNILVARGLCSHHYHREYLLLKKYKTIRVA